MFPGGARVVLFDLPPRALCGPPEGRRKDRGHQQYQQYDPERIVHGVPVSFRFLQVSSEVPSGFGVNAFLIGVPGMQVSRKEWYSAEQ